jgi:hypothetical protein
MFMRRSFLLITLLLGMSLPLSQSVEAQTRPKYRVLIRDCVNRSRVETLNIANSVMGRIGPELVKIEEDRSEASRKPEFELIDNQEAEAAAKRLNMDRKTIEGRFRVAKELKADLIAESEAYIIPARGKGNFRISVLIMFMDVRLQECVGFGFATETTKSVEQAALGVVQKAIRSSWSYLRVSATVVNVIGELVMLDRGSKDGLKTGDYMIITRQNPNGEATKQGEIRVARVFTTKAEAEIVSIGSLRPEDNVIRVCSVEVQALRRRANGDPPLR